jgi:hypothetical protein
MLTDLLTGPATVPLPELDLPALLDPPPLAGEVLALLGAKLVPPPLEPPPPDVPPDDELPDPPLEDVDDVPVVPVLVLLPDAGVVDPPVAGLVGTVSSTGSGSGSGSGIKLQALLYQ